MARRGSPRSVRKAGGGGVVGRVLEAEEQMTFVQFSRFRGTFYDQIDDLLGEQCGILVHADPAS